MALNLCPHDQNPTACLKCFHAKQQAPKNAPAAIVRAPNEISVDEVAARVKPANMPKQGAPVAGNDGPQKNYEPFSYGAKNPPPESFQNDKVWTPAKRESLIDRLPSHPNAGEPPAKR